MEKIRWGILSTAKIGLTQVIPAMQLGEFSEVIAISSRSLDKAEVAASSLGLERAYGSYEALLEDPDVDAIYNPLPNNMHLEWTVKAMKAGKHVLCEKPMAVNAVQVQKIIDKAKKNNLFLMEAMWSRFFPIMYKLRELLAQEIIGDLHVVVGDLSFIMGHDLSDPPARTKTGRLSWY